MKLMILAKVKWKQMPSVKQSTVKFSIVYQSTTMAHFAKLFCAKHTLPFKCVNKIFYIFLKEGFFSPRMHLFDTNLMYYFHYLK